MQKLEPLIDSEVTGLACLHDNKLLAVGWSQKMVQYDLSAAEVKSKVLEIESVQQCVRRGEMDHSTHNIKQV